MRIVVKSAASGEWKLVESADYDNEAELQKLLAESPSLIPVDEIREDLPPLVAAVREFGLPGSGSTDLLAFTAEGDVAVIECKLAANQEIRRKVVGQILEYGAYLWGMSYEEVDERVYQRSGRRLADLVGEAVDGAEWDEEAFRHNVAEALAAGRFCLIVAVDEINDELARTVRFLNGCAQSAFSFSALEMRRFQEGESEMLVPHVYGAPSVAKPPSASRRRQWNRDEFFEAARARLSIGAVRAIEDLYEWSTRQADRIKWGTGTTRGSFSFHYLQNGTVCSVFSVLTDGELWINYNSLSLKVSPEVLQAFHRALHGIAGLSHIPADFGKWPVARVEEAFAGQPEALAKFKAAVEVLGKRIHG